MKRMPQPIPYQGSKRVIANHIIQYVPKAIQRIIEPFAGSAAISVAAAYRRVAETFYLNDLNQPLADLLRLIINQPEKIAQQYQEIWTVQLGREREFYDEVRADFNRTHRPEFFLYLLARCVKGAVRYNANGEFNQAPDNRRKGRHPVGMQQEIKAFSELLQGKTIVTSLDYREICDDLDSATDFVYLDPPYQGTSGTRDARYCSGVRFTDLVCYLEQLNNRGIMFALSYDGVKGEKTYGAELPSELKLHKMYLNAGRSTQSTLLGRNDVTYESLYLSPALVTKLDKDVSWRNKSKSDIKALTISSPQLGFELIDIWQNNQPKIYQKSSYVDSKQSRTNEPDL